MILAVLAVLAAALYAHRCRVAVRRIRASADADVARLAARVVGLEQDLAALDQDLTSGTDREALAAIERLAREGYGPAFTQAALVTYQTTELYSHGHAAFVGAILRTANKRLPK